MKIKVYGVHVRELERGQTNRLAEHFSTFESLLYNDCFVSLRLHIMMYLNFLKKESVFTSEIVTNNL